MSLAAANGTWGLNGRKHQELPLYGAEQVSTWNADDLIVLVEGEKARDALDRTDFFNVLGTVTGAGVSLNCSICYTLRDELLRTPLRRSSQNFSSAHSGGKRGSWFPSTKHYDLGGQVPRRAIGVWRRAPRNAKGLSSTHYTHEG
jgi:hypothetical protein